jgi:hypothetical protein
MATGFNELEKFITYNPVWTFYPVPLSVLQSGEPTYRNPDSIQNVIFSSAGRYAENRAPTAFGSPEYFVDNVEIRSFITGTPGAGNTSQIAINFELFEPFSLGLFLQSCQIAAVAAGYKSYLDNAAYCLMLEFKGQTDFNSYESVGPYFFLVRLKKVDFTVNEGGSKYKIETFPFNQQVLNPSTNTLWNDCKLKGKTALEVLVDHPEMSLINQLNQRERDLVEEKKKLKPDFYSIVFRADDTGKPNPFGTATGGSLEFDANSTGGVEVFKRPGDVYQDGKVVRGKITLNPKEKIITFPQALSIQNAIDSVLLSTKEAREAVTKESKVVDGFITWWRVQPDVILIEYDDVIKDWQKLIIFNIVPYKIHHSIFMPPGASARGIPKLRQEVAREYNYIFTGKNIDVLKFDIEINNLMFTAVDPNPGHRTGVQVNPGVNASVAPDAKLATSNTGGTGGSPAGDSPRVAPSFDTTKLPFPGGTGNVNAEQKVANDFYINALTNWKGMTNLNLEILGDPYWLPEAAIGGYNPKGDPPGSPTTENGTMNYGSRDIHVVVNFRTPADYDGQEQKLIFQDGSRVSPFSGLYKVSKVEHKFSGGVYKCTLTGPRMYGQDTTTPSSIFMNSVDEPDNEGFGN